MSKAVTETLRKYLTANLPETIFEQDKDGNLTSTIKKDCIVFTDDKRVYVTDNNGKPIRITDIFFSGAYLDDLYNIAEADRLTEKVYITGDRKAYVWTGSDFEPLNLGAIEYIWLKEVNDYADIASTYPAPVNYNAVAVRVDSTKDNQHTWYAYDADAAEWVYKGLYFGDFRDIAVSYIGERTELISAGTEVETGIYYLSGMNQLNIFLDGVLLVKDKDYTETGTEGDYASAVKYLYDIPINATLVYVKNIARQDTITPFKVTHAEIGQYGMFAMEEIPDTYLVADGSAISRTAFSRLFHKIGTKYGAGDGSTTFNLPNFQGYFPRAWDPTLGVDTEVRDLGSLQGDAIRNIKGRYACAAHAVLGPTGPFYLGGSGGWRDSVGVSGDTSRSDYWFDASRVVPTADENRPKNLAVLMCIKYKMF